MIVGYYSSMPILMAFGTAYPAYASFKAVKDDSAEGKARWLQYWIVFAILCSIEVFIDGVGAYVPLYYECKIAFVLWLALDRFQGATLLCSKYVTPFLSENESVIDEKVEMLAHRFRNLKADDVRNLVEWAQAQGGAIATAKAAAKKLATKEQADGPQEPGDEAEVVDKPDATETTGEQKKDK